MATLSSILNSLAPVAGGGIPNYFAIYHTSTNSVSNGGCCCLWTVPAGTTSMKMWLYGGGASGNSSCCCAFQSHSGTGGQFTFKRLDVTPGCQYRFCAGGSSCCAYDNSNVGCGGCSTYVQEAWSGTTVGCACGGEQGSNQPGFTSPFSNYSCCWGRIQGGSSANWQPGAAARDYGWNGTGQMGKRNTYCFTDYWYYSDGGWGQGGMRSYNLCETTWYGHGRQKHNGDGIRTAFPGGSSYSGISCGGTHDHGQFGAGGLIIVAYSS